jgi:hypothetical protein
MADVGNVWSLTLVSDAMSEMSAAMSQMFLNVRKYVRDVRV